jgi:hypothetical protein
LALKLRIVEAIPGGCLDINLPKEDPVFPGQHPHGALQDGRSNGKISNNKAFSISAILRQASKKMLLLSLLSTMMTNKKCLRFYVNCQQLFSMLWPKYPGPENPRIELWKYFDKVMNDVRSCKS